MSGPAEGPTTSPASRQRLLGLDVARAAAIVGMLMVNIGPVDQQGVAGTILRLPHGRASLLFVVLAGVGMTILTRRARQGEPVPWIAVLWRAAILGLLGLSTQLLEHDVNVILTTYAALFVIALPLVRAPSWLLVLLSGALAVAGPVVYLLAQLASQTAFDGKAGTVQDSPGSIVTATFLTGPYPVITWLAPFLFGMWLGRADLSARAVQIRLLVIGAVLAIGTDVLSQVLVGNETQPLGPERLLSGAAHTQMPLWLIGSTGAAMAVLGLILLIVPLLGRAAVPLAHAGQLALTLYTAHLFIVAGLIRPGPDSASAGLATAAGLSLVLIAAATLWRRFLPRGPLEIALRPSFLPTGPNGAARRTPPQRDR